MQRSTESVYEMADERGSRRHWHLVMTKPGNEEGAVANLCRQGYLVYFPRLVQKVFRRGKWCDRISALFPRYLFVQLDVGFQSLAPIRSTIGVAHVVRFGLEYVTVPGHVVTSLKRREDSLSGLHQLHDSAWLKRGDDIVVTSGSLKGLEGIFESDDGRHRVTVLLNMLGREARIQVDASCVIKGAA